MSAGTIGGLLTAAGFASPGAGAAAEDDRGRPLSRAVPAAPDCPGQRNPLNAKAVPAVPGVPSENGEVASTNTVPAEGPAETTSARLASIGQLRTIADACGVPAFVVERIDCDPAELAALPEPTLAAYLHALHDRCEREAGRVPAGYSEASTCDGCGPVWLWPGAGRVAACPWCWERRAGRAVPRPGASNHEPCCITDRVAGPPGRGRSAGR